jgi:hypothetical protein
LTLRGQIEVVEPLLALAQGVCGAAGLDLDGAADWTHHQLVANLDSTLVGHGLRKGDLQLAGHLGHASIVSRVKEWVKDSPLTRRAPFPCTGRGAE